MIKCWVSLVLNWFWYLNIFEDEVLICENENLELCFMTLSWIVGFGKELCFVWYLDMFSKWKCRLEELWFKIEVLRMLIWVLCWYYFLFMELLFGRIVYLKLKFCEVMIVLIDMWSMRIWVMLRMMLILKVEDFDLIFWEMLILFCGRPWMQCANDGVIRLGMCGCSIIWGYKVGVCPGY